MNDKNLHIDQKLTESQLNDFLAGAEVPYAQSKEEIWERLSQKLEETSPQKSRFIHSSRWVAVAAALIVLIGLAVALRFHTTTIQSPPGQHLVCDLPDGSQVQLNAASTITYHPWWWRFSREIQFEGEAFFEVQKGSPFRVISKTGKTEVLGTSFNIFARSDSYEVQCVTGKVKVVSPSSKEVVLLPDYSASIKPNGEILVQKNSESRTSYDWIHNKFNFTSVPLKAVFQEVERQYNVTIQTGISPELIYTGHFQGRRDVEDVLALLCKPFGLQFEKISDRNYRVY